MRANEFEKKLKPQLRLGEIATSMCFLNRDDKYTLAVLCIEPEIIDDKYIIKAIPGLIYWDNEHKEAKRENISFQEQKKFNIPFSANIKSDDNTTYENVYDLKDYYISIEKICCALDLDCVTSSMKTKYRDIMGFELDTEIEKVFWYFFPDAMKKLN